MPVDNLTQYKRRKTRPVRVGQVVIGGGNPVVVQTMTNCSTLDTDACVAQIKRCVQAGCKLVRLTTQGVREARNLGAIREALTRAGVEVSLSADVHFTPEAALEAALYADKVRINPGNYRDPDTNLPLLLKRCKERGVALRIGVNHGSLSPQVVEQYGDTPQGMVFSAMDFVERCVKQNFFDVVISMKSSNVRVMVHAVRMLVQELDAAGLDFPVHLGVTEAGDGEQGRIKSSVGIGALLADGIGDTIRVSLSEEPENEIPVAQMLIGHVAARGRHDPIVPHNPIADPDAAFAPVYHDTSYLRRQTDRVGRIGGGQIPLLYSELNHDELMGVKDGKILLLGTPNANVPAALRAMILEMELMGDRDPVIVTQTYRETSPEALMVKASADLGLLFLDGLADGICIDNQGNIPDSLIETIGLQILQAARVRSSVTEYIACPGCGRTLYDLQSTLQKIKALTAGMPGVKIGVMGCIVNGPGEMADADFGYVGSGPGKVTLYKGREVVKRNIPEGQAPEELAALIRGSFEK